MTKVRNIDRASKGAPEGASEGARRATGEAPSGAALADVEVVAVAKRRQFSATEKNRILAEAARCAKPGEIGALLRREGIYSSMLHKWRQQQTAALQNALAPKRRGSKIDPALADARKMADLTQENARLQNKLAQAHTIIDVQKKLCSLFGLPSHDTPNEASS
jgi:transposase-like protein